MIQQSGHFCTFLYGLLHLPTRTFRYVSAGHPGPIQTSAEGPRAHWSSGGIPIGVQEDAEWVEDELQLLPGTQLIFTTDGVCEARNLAGEEFGEQGILGVLEDSDEGPTIENTVQRLHKQMLDFSEGQAPRDDVTIVGLGLV
jgi:sigma-B regulation protein RsbU (phosphoserine phosphatase)